MSLVNLLRKKSKNTLFTTPSHGQKFFIFHKLMQLYKYDISETETHDPVTALAKAETYAAHIYGTKFTKFLTNGSTSGIISAVLACVKPGEKVLIAKRAHPCHLNAVKLAGAIPVFYEIPQIAEWGITGRTSPTLIENCLNSDNFRAVIITSPTYEGIVSDIAAIKDICAKCGVYLIVDEAHGALYPFSDRLPTSAVKIADFCIQSLHKTAGGLNPTALLHSNCINPDDALSMVNTTSPSYPLLASIEANIKFLNSLRGNKVLNRLLDHLEVIRKHSKCEIYGDDLTKINIKKHGYSGYEISDKLFHKFGIEDEKTNDISTMLLCGIGTNKTKLERLDKALKKL